MKLFAKLIAGAVLLLCAATVAADEPDNPPLERLPAWAVPLSYDLAFKIDPAKDRFTGSTKIKLQLKRASDHLWLHGKELQVSQVTVTDAAGEKHDATWVDAAPQAGVVRIDFEHTLPPQTLTLEIEYSAPFNQQLQGLYKVEHAGHAYAMTQMEPVSARFAFPSFDEPGFKTPFDIHMTIPADLVGVANTSLKSTKKSDDGFKALTFTTTKPLPTYLVAFAVGPWDVVDGPTIAANEWRDEPLPLRGIAATGEGKRMQHALSETPVIIETLEDYYAFGYPFDKLDLAAVPDFAAGAMENAGLVTFRDWLLLLDEDSAARYVRRSFNVNAHELAHQWTGDTVTMEWWDDIWLNEAFATWMQQKVTQKVHPEYRADLSRVSGAQGAMNNDSLVSARKIRQPITGNGDIQTAFDSITYQKGAAVLGMFEGLVGEDTFRAGMRAYIQQHKFANATAADLVDAIADAAGKGADFKHAFKSFLNQSGVPVIATDLDCSGEQPVLHLAQSRYLPLGSSGDPERIWGVPVCVRTGLDAGDVQCQMLADAKGDVTLDVEQCPTWYMPNANASGYYRFSMPDEELAALTKVIDSLSDAEKLAYADAIDAAFHAGTADADAVLAAVRQLADSNTRQVALAPLDAFDWLWYRLAETDAQRARLTALIKDAYLPRLQKLGYVRIKGESADDALMRSALASLLGSQIKLPSVRKALLKQADAALERKENGHLALDAANPDLLGTVLGVAVEERGEPLVKTLMAELGKTTDPAQRNALLSGLSHAEGGDLERVRDFALGDPVKVGEMGRLLYGGRDTQAGRDSMWQWFNDHFEQVLERTGSFASGRLPSLAGGGGCSTAEADRLHTFFEPRIDELTGVKRGLAQTTESIRLCAALKQAQDLQPAQDFSSEKR